MQSVFYSRSHDSVIQVFDAACNVIETHEHMGEFKEWYRNFVRRVWLR
jgi:hypothetical protein